MKSHDVAMSTLDREVGTLGVDAAAAGELFAIVDALELQASLRRALVDPSASVEQRQTLAGRVLGARVGEPALQVVQRAIAVNLPSGKVLVDAIERQGVGSLLRVARDQGELDRVADELHAFVRLVQRDPELSDALRNRALPLANRQALVRELAASRVHAITLQLLQRAAEGRVRNLPLTVDHYLELAAEVGQQNMAAVTVAKPLDPERTARLQRALEAQVGGPVTLKIDVDPRVIGGIDVRIGNDTIESTIAGRLADARRLLNTSPSKVGRNG